MARDLFDFDPTAPIGSPTRLEDIKVDRGAAIQSTIQQTLNTGLGAAIQSWATKNPSSPFATGKAITNKDALEKYGLTLPGKPTDTVSEDWAKREQAKAQYTAIHQKLAENNGNFDWMTMVAGGLGGAALDPAEWGVNLATAGLVGGAIKAARLGGAGAGLLRVTEALSKVPGVKTFGKNAAEAVISAGVSTGLTAAQATQQDAEAVFGEGGYGEQQAATDTGVSLAFTLAIQGLAGLTVKGAGVAKNTLQKIVDPNRAAVEISAAQKTGRPINPANMVDVQKTSQNATVLMQQLDDAIAELGQAEQSLARHNIPELQAEQSARVFQDAFNAQELVTEAADALAATEARVLERVGGTDIVEAQRKLGADVLEARKRVKILEAEQLSLDQTKPEGAARATEIQAQVEEAKAALGEIEPLYKELIDARKLEQSVRSDAAAAPDYEKLLPSVTHVEMPIYRPNSLKKSVTVDNGRFNLPVDGSKITSQFGPRHGRHHNGIDLAGHIGDPVRSSRSGTVIRTGNQKGGAGNFVEVDHGGGYVTKYFHLNEIKVKKGQKVTSKDLVGTVGNTGRSTGPHLHFELWKDGKKLNPEMWLNRKTAIADAPPVSRDVPAVKLPDDAPIHVHEFDDVALSSRNMTEFVENGRAATKDLVDAIGNYATKGLGGIDRLDAIAFREGIENGLDVLKAYTNIEALDIPRVMGAFERGGARAIQLIDAVAKSPEASIDAVIKILDDARSIFKDKDVRKAAEIGTKLTNKKLGSTPDNLAKQLARQEAIAESLPTILAAHQILADLGHPRVTEELPVRYFMQMFGEELSDFGKAIVGDLAQSNNSPLYRFRRDAVNRLSSEVERVRGLLGEIRKEAGVSPYLSPDEIALKEALDKGDEILATAIPEDVKGFLALAETTKAEIDDIYQRYANTGLFDEDSIRRMGDIAEGNKAKIDAGDFVSKADGGDKDLAAMTKLENDKAYTAALEKVKDILFVCASRGFG